MKTYAKKLTKKSKAKFRNYILVGIVFIALGSIGHFAYLTDKAMAYEVEPFVSHRELDVRVNIGNKIEGTIREVTAYNVGDPNQTDSSPCISANGTNLCEALERGEKHCATNAFPFGTILEIQNYGTCVVSDRMNLRYPNRIDIAMKLSEKQRALRFGKQNLLVTKIR